MNQITEILKLRTAKLVTYFVNNSKCDTIDQFWNIWHNWHFIQLIKGALT